MSLDLALAMEMVETAWTEHGKDVATMRQLADAWNRAKPLAVTPTTMGQAHQMVRKAHKAQNPEVEGFIVPVAYEYGPGAEWTRVDIRKDIAEDHVGFIVADHLRRLHSDVAAEVRPGAAGKKIRDELDATYNVVKPLWEGVFARNGIKVKLPDKLPVK